MSVERHESLPPPRIPRVPLADATSAIADPGPSTARRRPGVRTIVVVGLVAAGMAVSATGLTLDVSASNTAFDVDDAVASVAPVTVPTYADGADENGGEGETPTVADDAPPRSPSDVPPRVTPDTVSRPESGSVSASDAPPRSGSQEDGSAPDAGASTGPAARSGEEALPAPPAEVEEGARPVGIVIDSIDVSRFPIVDVGLEDDGQLQVPDETQIGWYRYGSTAGREGATVLAAHVSWNRTVGPFFELGAVEPGDRIAVTLEDGTVRHYEVVERTMYDKLELPADRIWRRTGPETLVMITCGGDFNPEIRRYRQNIVVYAVPVG